MDLAWGVGRFRIFEGLRVVFAVGAIDQKQMSQTQQETKRLSSRRSRWPPPPSFGSA